jgi:Domain of unknown function (DUF4214)
MKRFITLLFALVLCLGVAQRVLAQSEIQPEQCVDCDPPPPDPCGSNPIDDPTFFVQQQYRDFLFRNPSGFELSNDVAALNSCLLRADFACYNTERVKMSRRMWDKPEFRQQSRTFGLPLFPDSNDPTLQFEHYNDDDFVRLDYYIYLQRAPDQSGYDFWLGSLNNCVRNSGSFQASDQCYNDSINAFLSSTEYRQRFGCQ